MNNSTTSFYLFRFLMPLLYHSKSLSIVTQYIKEKCTGAANF